jgi:ankyrin repeat protein
MKNTVWAVIVLGAALFCASTPGRADKGDDLLDAVIGNDNAKAAELIGQGADVNKAQPDGWTPLLFAVYNKNFEMAKLLVEKGADVNAHEFHAGSTVLMLAAAWGDAPFIRLLLQKKVDLNARQRAGNTALSYAISYQHDDIALLLKNAGAQ